MHKTISIFLFILLYTNFSFAQTKDFKLLIAQARESYETGDFELASAKIREIKSVFKTPPPIILPLEILTNCELIKKDLLAKFDKIATTKILASAYLKNKSNTNDKYYDDVNRENSMLYSYPKDKAALKLMQQNLQKEELQKREQQALVAAQEKERRKKEEENEIKRLEALKLKKEEDRLQAEKNRLQQVENDRLAQIKDDQDRLEENKRNQLIQAEVEKQRIIDQKKDRKRLKSFSSIGFQSGQIAKYGFLYERGGKKAVGFRLAARTSLLSEGGIFTGESVPNKTEIEIGPTIKLSKRVYLNLCGGYGYFNFVNSNDYSQTKSNEKKGYLVTSAGLMIRLNRIININGGASFMDIDKDIYTPEAVFGISFNLKGKSK